MTTLPAARSVAEASLWAELSTCECGGLGAGWEITRLDAVDADTTAVQLQSACGQCGRRRAVTCTVPARPEPPDHHFSDPDDGPSSLYDAAEWWAIADRYADVADTLAAGGWADRARAGAFRTRAATATDEVLRFLPAGAAGLPDPAFRTPWSREVAAARSELFTRAALERSRTQRWARCTDADDADDAVPPPAHPFARTVEEELLYLQLHPCSCGEPDFEPERGVDELADGTTIGLYRGRCTACGRTREFTFGEPAEPPVPDAEHWSSGIAPSELIDPGEWWLVARAIADVAVPAAEAVGSPSEVRSALLRCAAALGEVLKFVPEGADAVPEHAFTSSRGRAELLRSRQSFDRDVLEVRRQHVLDRVAGPDASR